MELEEQEPVAVEVGVVAMGVMALEMTVALDTSMRIEE